MKEFGVWRKNKHNDKCVFMFCIAFLEIDITLWIFPLNLDNKADLIRTAQIGVSKSVSNMLRCKQPTPSLLDSIVMKSYISKY